MAQATAIRLTGDDLRIEDVWAVAQRGEVMPQKSTFFYPKLTSGLLLFPVD